MTDYVVGIRTDIVPDSWVDAGVALMRHYGYTDEEILGATEHDPHTSGRCYYEEPYGWVCVDEYERSFHPAWDELDRIWQDLQIIGPILEAGNDKKI